MRRGRRLSRLAEPVIGPATWAGPVGSHLRVTGMSSQGGLSAGIECTVTLIHPYPPLSACHPYPPTIIRRHPYPPDRLVRLLLGYSRNDEWLIS